jgi:hypothetical protein
MYAICEIPITNGKVITLNKKNIKWFHTFVKFEWNSLDLEIKDENGDPIKFIDDDVKIDITLTLKNCEDCRILQNQRRNVGVKRRLSCNDCQKDKKVMS